MCCGALHIDLSVIQDSVRTTPDRAYRFVRKLGWGAEGAVWEAIELLTNKTVAVKTIEGPHNLRRIRVYNKLLNLRHPNVISVLDVQADESRCYIVMEKCEGDLLQAISRSAWRRFSEASASNFILQVLAGLTSCHSRGIFHGDVKPENILLTNTGQVKLCDFLLGDGSSSDLISGRMLGSTVYVAPEVYEHARGRSQARPLFDLAAADVWSLGVTLFAIVAGYIPWHKPDESDADFTRFVADPKGFCPTWFSAPLKSLITSMLQVSPEDRISLSDIWANPWVLHHMVNSSPRFASPFSHVASILIDDGFGVGSPSSQDYTDSEVESDKVVGELVYADAYTDPYTSVCGSPAKATFGARRTDLSPLKRKKQRRLLIPSSPFTPESPS